MTPALHQRCWNHEDRETVCRCPGCQRSFCRECVGEHEGRLLCTSCLKATVSGQRPNEKRRRLVRPALALAGVLLAWVAYFLAGETAMTLSGREQSQWQRR